MFSVSYSTFSIGRSSNLGGEGRVVYAGRKIVVEPGLIYVFMTGIMDQQGLQEIYRGGEIIYISDTADMQARKYVALNEQVAELTIVGERDILGVTSASDKATIMVRVKLTVKDPLKLANLVLHDNDANTALQARVESAVLHNIENTLAIWSQPEHELINIITTDINKLVAGSGLMLLHANTSVQRTMPRTLSAIQAEARRADLRLIEATDVQQNGNIAEALHEFDRKLQRKIFTPPIIKEWLAGAKVSGKEIHGKAFIQLVVTYLLMNSITTQSTESTDDTEDSLITFLLEGFHAVAIAKYVKSLRGTKLNVPSEDQIQDSTEIVINSFV